MCSVILVGDMAWKTVRNHYGLAFFRELAGRSQIIDLDRGPGIVLVHVPWTPWTFFWSAALHFTCFPFSFFFFFLPFYSSVAQTLKNVRPLDCKLRLLRPHSLSLGGKISITEFMHMEGSHFDRRWTGIQWHLPVPKEMAGRAIRRLWPPSLPYPRN